MSGFRVNIGAWYSISSIQMYCILKTYVESIKVKPKILKINRVLGLKKYIVRSKPQIDLESRAGVYKHRRPDKTFLFLDGSLRKCKGVSSSQESMSWTL